MKGLFGIFNPRELQDTKNIIAARNERDLNDFASKPLPDSFDVVIYSDSAATGQTATSTVGNSNPRHPSNFKWYRVKSLAGHNDMLPEPSDTSGVDREANIQSFYQAYYPLKESSHPKEGDVWSAILEGGNLVRLDKYIRDGEITRRTLNNSTIKQVDDSNDKKTVGEYLDGDEELVGPTLEQMQRNEPSKISDSDRELLKFISSGEGSYDAANNLKKVDGKFKFVFSIPKIAWVKKGKVTNSKEEPDQKKISELTIGEIMKLQEGSYPERDLFAVGAYQIIPVTLIGNYAKAGLSTQDVFTPENQDKIGLSLIYLKRAELGKYLLGKTSNLDLAQTQFAAEWASIPKPDGKGYYETPEGFNKPSKHHTVKKVRDALIKAREANIAAGRTEF